MPPPARFAVTVALALAAPIGCALAEYGTKHLGKRLWAQLTHFQFATCDVDMLLAVLACQVGACAGVPAICAVF